MTRAEALDAVDGRYPAKRKRIEEKLQIAVVEYMRIVLDPKRYKVVSIRNEGKRSAREGALAKAMGLEPGITDLVIIGPLGASWWIEMKTESGKLSDEQAEIRAWMAANGVPHALCRSIDDVRVALAAWNIPTREATT
jgi:hypothetical protein